MGAEALGGASLRAIFSIAFGFAAHGSAQPEFVPLGDLPGGGFRSFATAVSPDGSVVVGISHSANSELEGFRWEAGVMEPLGDLPGGLFLSIPYGVSERGIVIVGQAVSAGGFEAFRWSREQGMIGMGWLPGGGTPIGSAACGVTPDGTVIVGDSGVVNGAEAFRWEEATGMKSIGDLPGGPVSGAACSVSHDGAVVVGTGWSSAGIEPFRWTMGAGMQALGCPGSTVECGAGDVSADGNVIVGDGWTSAGVRAARWTSHTGWVQLGTLGGASARNTAWGVSADGWVIVGQAIEGQFFTSFIWDPVRGMRDLKVVLTDDYALNLEGWKLSGATGISDDASAIVGAGINPEGGYEGWLARIHPFCYADCDDSTGLRTLDVLDFLCFAGRFNSKDLYTDCNQDGQHDLFDFLCFLNHFNAGCP